MSAAIALIQSLIRRAWRQAFPEPTHAQERATHRACRKGNVDPTVCHTGYQPGTTRTIGGISVARSLAYPYIMEFLTGPPNSPIDVGPGSFTMRSGVCPNRSNPRPGDASRAKPGIHDTGCRPRHTGPTIRHNDSSNRARKPRRAAWLKTAARHSVSSRVPGQRTSESARRCELHARPSKNCPLRVPSSMHLHICAGADRGD